MRGNIIGNGTVGIFPYTVIKDVCLVTELKYNMLTISHLADNGYGINFVKDKYSIYDMSTGNPVYEGIKKDNIYVFLERTNSACKCLVVNQDESWL